MSAALVSLIGPPGSGKTTAAGYLAEALGGRLVLEDYAGNPFLAESYAGRTDLRLAGQAWFLLSRVHQLAAAHWPEEGVVVSDYAFVQDAVYARIWLRGAPWEAYRRLAAQVAPLVRPPTVLVHLDGPMDLLRRRIAARGRKYEAFFTPAFLARLSAEYDRVVAEAACPVLRVDIARRDLLEPAARQGLLEGVRAALAEAPGWP